MARRDRLIATLARVHANRVGPGSADPTGFNVVVNATPIGMRAGDPSPVDLANLTPEMYVADVIALPEITPLLEFARWLGCNTQTGMQMFAASAELTVDFFLGGTPA